MSLILKPHPYKRGVSQIAGLACDVCDTPLHPQDEIQGGLRSAHLGHHGDVLCFDCFCWAQGALR